MKIKLILSIILTFFISYNFACESANQVTKDFIAAIEKNDIDLAKKLLKDKSLNLACKISGITPILYYTLLEGQINLAYEILNEALARKDKREIIDARTNNNETPLMLAIFKGYKALAEMLISAGADVKVQANDGATALMYAILNGFDDLINKLIEKGASLIIETKEGKKNLVDFVRGENKKKIDAFQIQLNNELLNAVKINNKSKINKLIRIGANINATDEFGNTALILASKISIYSQEYVELIKLLLKANANADHKNVEGNTALMEIIKNLPLNYNSEPIKLLVANSNINLTDNNGRTALIIAAATDAKIVKLLLEAKADPNIKAIDGSTALQYAKDHNFYELAELLIKYGAKN